MSTHLKNLFSPYFLKGRRIKNRLMRSPMVLSMATRDGFVTQDLVAVYEEAAQGGVGLFCTECLAINAHGRITTQQIGIWSDELIPGLTRLADTIHGHGEGCLIWGQLGTEGAHQWGYSYGQQDAKLSVDTINEEQIQVIINAFAEGAFRVKQAGLDGVHLHGGHGYLISQFLSPAVNHRTDKWGGSLEKRALFPLEVYGAIRARVGDDFPIGIKMNSSDYLPGGHWVSETAKLARLFSLAGFDLLEMSGGMGYMIELREALRKKVGSREYYFIDAIPAFREAVKGTTTALAAVGGIRTPSVMEELLNEGIDLISMGRPWLSEPDLANRIKAGDQRTARCVSGYRLCNLCLSKLAKGSVQCEKFYPGDCLMTCPLDQDNPTYLSLLVQGKMDESLEVIKEDNPLANSLSRICHHPCENVCRGKNGEPLSLRDLKRFVTDYGLKHGYSLEAKLGARQRLATVAIAGAGPAGLTCAFYLAKWGFRPTVFEKLPVLGGMLAWAIPRYRLPHDTLNADLAYVKSAGVEFKTGITVGKDVSLPDLFDQGYKAVFLAIGTSLSKSLRVEGAELPGVIQGLDLLSALNAGKRSVVGRRVVVIGGGNVAVDAAMSAGRLGAAEVCMICLETREEMPAHREQVEEALEERIKILSGWGPRRIRGGRKVEAIDLVKCTSVFDNRGVFNPSSDDTVTMSVEADTVVLAIGQEPDTSWLNPTGQSTLEHHIRLTETGTISVSPYTLETSLPGVFAGGDVTTGPKSVVEAVGAGKIAAESIVRYLTGQPQLRTDPYRPFVRMTRPSAFAYPSETTLKENSKRVLPPKRAFAERRADFDEVTGRLSEEQAISEAKRCMKYDLELEEESAARLAQMGKTAFILSPEEEPGIK
jgi:NADPH-dependent glutamate synthase beta subunit-like oxidoreductase/2,4-dienoyl-CoA reductase-like NADH-dependent reductase (Old Yellow Enzyme family)